MQPTANQPAADGAVTSHAAAPESAAPAATQRDAPAVTPRRGVRDYVTLTAKGFCMGSADVVPGVSGGTMAFILGIYEELLQSIRTVGRPEFMRAAIGLRIHDVFQLLNWRFLATVLFGIALAVITLAPGIEWLLTNRPVMLWSFFFGLVLASVFTVSRRIARWTPLLWIALLVGTIFAYWIVGLVPTQTPNTWWFLILSGAIASCAMILPGISGSFILVLLSKYEYFVGAVNSRDLISLALAGIGAVVGLVTFAQVLSWLFKRYHDATVALLTGLMIGSLRKVWPWKETMEFMTDGHGALIPLLQRNVLPPLTAAGGFNLDIVYALGLALVGFALVLLIERWGNHSQNATESSA